MHDMIELMAPGTVSAPEGPRWHSGALWFSDQWGHHVWQLRDGNLHAVAEVERPSGLGFLPDGSLVIASMATPIVTRQSDEGRKQFADLTEFTGPEGLLNDLVADDEGRCYVNVYGTDAVTNGALAMITPGCAPVVVASGLAVPNGMAITADRRTLVVSESFGGRITAFDIEPDGSLTGRRVWAEVDGMFPDGLCLDANGDIWVASFTAGEFLHVREGGEVLDRIGLPAGRWALACALGGVDGRTLFLCSAETDMDRYAAGDAVGHLESLEVDVPGAGRS